MESACPSVYLSMYLSVQNTSFCQSDGECMKSILVTLLVYILQNECFWVYWNQPVCPYVCLCTNTSFCQSSGGGIDSLPNDKFSDMAKLKVFADIKLNIAKMKIYLYDRVENTVGKGENAVYQHFLLFPQCFPKPSSR